jgi:hypothetical protein
MANFKLVLISEDISANTNKHTIEIDCKNVETVKEKPNKNKITEIALLLNLAFTYSLTNL